MAHGDKFKGSRAAIAREATGYKLLDGATEPTKGPWVDVRNIFPASILVTGPADANVEISLAEDLPSESDSGYELFASHDIEKNLQQRYFVLPAPVRFVRSCLLNAGSEPTSVYLHGLS